MIQAARYIIRKLIGILLTIFIGVFLVVWMMDQPTPTPFGPGPSPLENALYKNINISTSWFVNQVINTSTPVPVEQLEIAAAAHFQILVDRAGLEDPPFIRHLKWTAYALIFHWGDMEPDSAGRVAWVPPGAGKYNLNQAVLDYLPPTLLLAGISFLLLFLISLPLSLYISQRPNSWVDRALRLVAPLSSVPAWVIGIILIMLFAVSLRWLPPGNMWDGVPPETLWGRITTLARHLVLPVSAILLSLVFQLVNTWRTIFVTFGNEDYVELGKAQGLSNHAFQRDYHLRPSLPFVMTSYTLLLIGFWQLTMAVEIIFNWRGIGWLYIKAALPNYWDESWYQGEVLIALTLVVLFAYILGLAVFVLDLAYVMVDPRIRLLKNGPKLRSINTKAKKQKPQRSAAKEAITRPLPALAANHNKGKPTAIRPPQNVDKPTPIPTTYDSQQIQRMIRAENHKRWKRQFRLVFHTPSAIVGMLIILFLLAGSIYAIVALPYQTIGSKWSKSIMSSRKVYIPKVANPTWLNWFRKDPHLSRIILNSHQDAQKTVQPAAEGTSSIRYVYTIDYPYKEFPTEFNLYLDAKYSQKRPFVELEWHTPDGRLIDLKGTGAEKESSYDLAQVNPIRRWVSQTAGLKEWFVFERYNTTPAYYLLFANPESLTPQVVSGEYTLVMDVVGFETGSDVDSELTVMGSVWGPFGTDIYRRDLTVPLFWGMPIALIIGMGGALITTLLSLLLAAVGVWFNGWVDDLIQRLTEVNLILPTLAITILAHAYLGVPVWVVLLVNILLNIFGAHIKSFRAALLQVRELPYIEAAQAYNASASRIIWVYLIRKILPIMIPQLIILIPAFVFLEATLGLFNINLGLPTWGNVIYEATRYSASYGGSFWVLQPIALLLLTGVGFGLFGQALERLLDPRLQDE